MSGSLKGNLHRKGESSVTRFGVAAALAGTFVLLGVNLVSSNARADVIYLLGDTTNGVSASADFKVIAGGFEVIVTNTESNTPDAGHAISQFSFTVGDGLAFPTAMTGITGTSTTFSGPATPVHGFTMATNVGSSIDYEADHWAFITPPPAPDNGQVLDVAGPIGGQPMYLIVAAGSTPDSSLTNTHLPSFVGATTFIFSDPTVPANLTTADITNVQFAFGTQPEVPLESGSSPSPGPTLSPLPSSFWGGFVLLGGVLAARRFFAAA